MKDIIARAWQCSALLLTEVLTHVVVPAWSSVLFKSSVSSRYGRRITSKRRKRGIHTVGWRFCILLIITCHKLSQGPEDTETFMRARKLESNIDRARGHRCIAPVRPDSDSLCQLAAGGPARDWSCVGAKSRRSGWPRTIARHLRGLEGELLRLWEAS